ncbi:MAG: sec-independent protein translocase protein TatA [Acidobacteriaceae bacterium]|jgi:sec-independent protein translocase protein TatA
MFEGLFQPMHLLVIAGIALLIFGPKKLPELGKGLGEGLRGFKAAMSPSTANSAAVDTPIVKIVNSKENVPGGSKESL